MWIFSFYFLFLFVNIQNIVFSRCRNFWKQMPRKKLLLAQQCDTKSLFVRNKQNCVSQNSYNPPKLRIKYFPKTLEKILLFRRFQAVRNACFVWYSMSHVTNKGLSMSLFASFFVSAALNPANGTKKGVTKSRPPHVAHKEMVDCNTTHANLSKKKKLLNYFLFRNFHCQATINKANY